MEIIHGAAQRADNFPPAINHAVRGRTLMASLDEVIAKTGLNVPFSGQNYQGGDRQHGVIYLLCHLEVGNKRDLHSFQFCFCQK